LALDPHERFHDYVRDNWSSENGLPQVSVLTITQDGTGYLWIGTQNGIARFDGVRFSVFDRRSTGADTTMATVSYTDRQGQPWFGTAHGALRFVDGRFEELHASGGNVAVQGIAEYGDSLLFATSLGVMRLRGSALEPALLDGERSSSLLSDGGVLWVGQTGQLVRIDDHGITRFALPPAARNASVSRLSRTTAGLWLGTTSGLFRLRDDRVEPSGLDPRLDRLTTESLYRDGNDNLWIGTAPMLFRLRSTGQLEQIGEDDFVRDSWILAAYEDREGNLWLGSQTEGLFRLWDGWVQRVSRREGLSDAFVWSVARDPQGRIVFGTNSNVAVRTAQGTKELVAGTALPNPSAYDLFYDNEQRLWIGTRAGVAIFDEGKVVRPPALASLDAYQINTVVEDGTDFWIGSSGGLYHYAGDQLTRIGAAPGQTSARVRSLHLLAPGRLLVGTESGLHLVNGDALTTPAWAAPFDGRMISYIAPIRDGMLGVATLDFGLGLVAGDKLTVLTTDQGLPSDNAWTFRTVDGQLYVAGIEGVWRVPIAALPDPASDSAPTLKIAPQVVLSASGRERGSQRVRCCNGGAQARSVVDDGGGIWLTSISGALRLDTKAIAYTQAAPRTVIEALRHGNRWLRPARAMLDLDTTSRDVEIDFTALSFRDPNSLRFHYRLGGYDSDWIDAGSRRNAFYTNLSPGDYRFEVQASVPNMGFSGDGASLAFRIEPRWYERGSVRLALAALALCLFALLVRQRLRGYRAAQQRLEQLVSERTLALSHANERLRQANRLLAFESQTDPLTALHNRRFLFDNAAALFDPERAETLALLLLDLDHFKQVNDRYGHAAGDDVLTQLARLLQHLAREGDHVLRWGGEEFLIVVRSVRAEKALDIAERLRVAVSRQVFSAGAGRTLHLTCSIGVSMHPVWPAEKHIADWSLTLELADAALYRVKQEGRNGSLGLVAGANLADINLSAREADTVDTLVANRALAWLRPGSTAQLRVVT